MRLTLRTLLAYLDDTLEPAQANLIGQKVAESTVAQELIDRIKRVTRRRSLANPPVIGDDSKLDPNTVAEYLNDQLEADELAEVEQICLEQDVYLAEVASCHQILTLMLSEPARVPPTARQRMYRLVKGRESIPYRRPPVSNPLVPPAAPIEEASENRTARWPLYVAGILALALALAGAVYLAWPKPATAAKSSADSIVLAGGPTMPSVSTSPVSGSTETSRTSIPTVASKTEPAVAPTIPKTAPAATTPATPTRTAEPAPPPVPFTKKAIEKAPSNEPNDQKSEIGRLSSPSVVLLQRSGGARPGWRRVPQDARVAAGVALLSLPGYRSDIKLDNGVVISLWGSLPLQTDFPTFESAVTFHAPAEGLKADLTIDRGRVVIANPMVGALKVRVRFEKESWDVTVGEQSEVYVNVLRAYPPGVPFSKAPGGEPPEVAAGLGVPKGKATVAILDREPVEMHAPPGVAILLWNNKKGLAEPQKIQTAPPQWSGGVPNRPQAKEAAEDLRKTLDELATRAASKDTDVESALQEFLQQERITAQIAAVFGLGAVDRVKSLIDALDEAYKPISRETVVALQHWCGRRAENDLELHALLRKKNFTETQADLAMELLHNYSDAEIHKVATYQALFNYLGNEKLAVRVLAFYHLSQFDPAGLKVANYWPDLEDPERTRAIDRWRKRLTDGKLPPKPVAPPPTPVGKP